MKSIGAALRLMLGPDVGIGVTAPAAPTSPLWPQEAVSMVRAAPKRRAEFTAGREAARIAMADLGLPAVAIPQGHDRAPVWPAGLSGSISHCQSWCIAAVALHANYTTLGIDIEPATPLESSLTDLICTTGERGWLAVQADPGLAAKMIFSAKEAVYKAQFPLTSAVIGFDAITLKLNKGGFFTTTAPNVPTISGAITVLNGMIISTAYV